MPSKDWTNNAMRLGLVPLALLLLVIVAAALGGGQSGSHPTSAPPTEQAPGSSASAPSFPEPGLVTVTWSSGDAVCVSESGVKATYSIFAVPPALKWVGYLTDGAGGVGLTFVSDGGAAPDFFSLPVASFPEEQAGLFVGGGVGLFATGSADGFRAILDPILLERDKLVAEYRTIGAGIADLEKQVRDEVAKEESSLADIFGKHTAEPNPPQYLTQVQTTSQAIDILKQRIASETARLSHARPGVEGLTFTLESLIRVNSLPFFGHTKCAVVDLDIRLPITDPIGSSREIVVEDRSREIGLSNPMPSIRLSIPSKTSITIAPDGTATVPIAGVVRDAIADLVNDGNAHILSVLVYVDQVLVKSVSLSPSSEAATIKRPFAKGFAFSDTLELKLTPHNERRIISFETSSNLIGNTGGAAMAILAAAKHDTSSGPGYFKLNPLLVYVPRNTLSSTDRDAIGVHIDASFHELGDDVLTETGVDTNIFVGSVPELGTVTVKIASFTPTSDDSPGSMTALLTSSLRDVSDLSFALQETGPRTNEYFDFGAEVTPLDDLPLPQYGIVLVQDGGSTGPGTFNPFYVRVFDPRGSGGPGMFGEQSFVTVSNPSLFGEVYFERPLLRVKKEPKSQVSGILGPATSLDHSYLHCLRTATLLDISFRSDGEVTETFQAIPAEFVDAMLSSKAHLSTAQRTVNAANLRAFALTMSITGATIRGIAENGEIADAAVPSGKPILVVDGPIEKGARTFLEQTVTVVHQDRVVVKKGEKEFAADQIKICCTPAQIARPNGTFATWRAENVTWGDRAIKLAVFLTSQAQVDDRKATGLKVLINVGEFNPFTESIDIDPAAGTLTVKPGPDSRVATLPHIVGTMSFGGLIAAADIAPIIQGGTEDKNDEFTTFEVIERSGDASTAEEQRSTRQDSNAFSLGMDKLGWRKNGEALYQTPAAATLIGALSNEFQLFFNIVSSTAHVFRTAGFKPILFNCASKKFTYKVRTARGVEERTSYDFSGLKRFSRNVADVLYYSGHGLHEPNYIHVAPQEGFTSSAHPTRTDAAGVHSLMLDDHWARTDLDIVIAAGCSLFDANVTINPALNTTKRDVSHPDWTSNPGLTWRTLGPKLFLGYRGAAPTDKQGGTIIAKLFTEELSKGADPDKLKAFRKAWFDANMKASAKGAPTDLWRNYAAIDAAAGKWYFAHAKDQTIDFFDNDVFTEKSEALP